MLWQPKVIENIYVARAEDIAAMKIIAIYQRGTYRDFVDIYYLLKQYNLADILKWTLEKYPQFNIYEGLRSLIYFEDAEENIKADEKRIMVFDKSLTWKKIKKNIADNVREYQLSFVK